MSANLSQVNTSAVQILTRLLQENTPRRQCIITARNELMTKLELTRDAAELACWRTLAELESRNIPAGHYIDLTNSTQQLLIVKTPIAKMVFTLADLLGFHNLHTATTSNSDQAKIVYH